MKKQGVPLQSALTARPPSKKRAQARVPHTHAISSTTFHMLDHPAHMDNAEVIVVDDMDSSLMMESQ